MIMRNLPFAYLFIGLLFIIGVAGTVWEYKEYRRIELQDYGHGWEASESLKDAETLVGPYVNSYQKYRIRYPKWWSATEEGGKLAKAKEVTLAHPKREDIFIKIFVRSEEKGAKDYADAIGKVSPPARDWDYVNNLVVLTWDDKVTFKQEALFSKEGILYDIVATCPTSAAKEYELTFKEVFKSFVAF